MSYSHFIDFLTDLSTFSAQFSTFSENTYFISFVN